jgi:hypothetical protein
MNGKILDIALIVSAALVFLAFAVFQPGIGNLLVALISLIGLGYYNSFVRHRHSDDKLRDAWR